VAAVNRAAADHAFDTFVFHRAQGVDVGHVRQAAGSDHGDGQRLGQLDGGVDVDAGEHAVAADVGIDDAFDAIVLEFFAEVDDFVAGHLAPAVRGNLAVLGIQADDDVAAKGR